MWKNNQELPETSQEGKEMNESTEQNFKEYLVNDIEYLEEKMKEVNEDSQTTQWLKLHLRATELKKVLSVFESLTSQ